MIAVNMCALLALAAVGCDSAGDEARIVGRWSGSGAGVLLSITITDAGPVRGGGTVAVPASIFVDSVRVTGTWADPDVELELLGLDSGAQFLFTGAMTVGGGALEGTLRGGGGQAAFALTRVQVRDDGRRPGVRAYGL